ncbi:MAG: cytochrome c [Flavobacteriales bacterium]|nr:cytochrome c [Flavobacteriales bacterium]
MLNKLIASVIICTGLVACSSHGENPGIEYAPDMYYSKGYEPYSQMRHMAYNENGMTMRKPVIGSIARGQLDYIYKFPDTPEGYEASASNLNAVEATEENLMEGERLYNIYCWSCHGKEGKNDGPVITEGKFAKPPFANYQDPYIQNLPDGKIYHVITYGKNMMGSHAHMLTPTQRWQVIHHVKKLSKNAAPVVSSDSTAVAAQDSTTN